MKFILSSNDFSRPETLRVIREELGMPFAECRLLFIPNEKASARQMRGEKFRDRMAERGFLPENVTVLNYYRAEEFRDLELDAILCSGGNTFGILYRLREHGFLDALEAYLRKGVTYIGGSAGVHLVGKDIAHVEPFDPNLVGLTDTRGMGLFNGIFFCHFGEERRPYYEKALLTSPCPVYALPNGASLVVKDGKIVRSEGVIAGETGKG